MIRVSVNRHLHFTDLTFNFIELNRASNKEPLLVFQFVSYLTQKDIEGFKIQVWKIDFNSLVADIGLECRHNALSSDHHALCTLLVELSDPPNSRVVILLASDVVHTRAANLGSDLTSEWQTETF